MSESETQEVRVAVSTQSASRKGGKFCDPAEASCVCMWHAAVRLKRN